MTGQKAQPGNEQSVGSTAEWRDDLDALQFPVPGHDAHCLVHRLAFRALVGVIPGGLATHDTVDASPQSRPTTPDRAICLALFARETPAFHAAARAKIVRQAIPTGKSLHLNSRDIRRALVGDETGTKAKACRVLGG